MDKKIEELGPTLAWMAALKDNPGTIMELVGSDMHKSKEEKIAELEQQIGLDKETIEIIDKFLATEDKSEFDIEGLEKVLDDIIITGPAEYMNRATDIISKTEIVKDRLEYSLEISNLLLKLYKDEPIGEDNDE